MKELLEFIIQNALPEGTEYGIKQIEDESGITFEMIIPEEYRGKIIGKGGANIKAIRNTINIVARRENQRVYLKVVD
jgi:predicted RNA-binding protein YlqC (UPF0109 family)